MTNHFATPLWNNPYFNTTKTYIAEDQRIHYNFVKPHMVLDGKTPAEASGIRIESENKWLALIRKSKNS